MSEYDDFDPYKDHKEVKRGPYVNVTYYELEAALASLQQELLQLRKEIDELKRIRIPSQKMEINILDSTLTVYGDDGLTPIQVYQLTNKTHITS